MKAILVLIPVEDRHKRCLEDIGTDCEFIYTNAEKLTDEQISRASVIIGNAPVSMMPLAKQLEWIQLNSAGADAYCKPDVLRPETLLTNATGAYGLAVSEHMLAMTMMLQKKLHLYHSNQKLHLWKDEGNVTSICKSVTLVLGLGDIGSSYAKKMKALGSHVIGIKRRVADIPEYLDELYTMDKLEELLPRADIVAMTLPNSPSTYHIINRERLALMKPAALLINGGRGTAIDQDALCAALQDGRLGGCAADVTDPEPLPEEHPLWDAPNMLITPHISGSYHLQETLEQIVRISSDNLRRFLAGEPLKNLVNRQAGY